MYYKENQTLAQITIEHEGMIIHINPEDSRNRFVVKVGGKENTCKCLNDVLEHAKESTERLVLKRIVYQVVKQVFYELELKQPDVTFGVIPFLEGKAYRTNQVELLYAFHMTPLFDHELLEMCIPPYKLHLHPKPLKTWPARLKATIISKDKRTEVIWLLDPYQLINIFINNIKKLKHKTTFTSPEKEKTEIFFESKPKYNKITIQTPIGKVDQNYKTFQSHILEIMRDHEGTFLVNVNRNLRYYIFSAFILNYWGRKRKSLDIKEQEEHDVLFYALDPPIYKLGTVPFSMEECIALGLDWYYSENPSLKYADMDEDIKHHTLYFAEQKNDEPDEYINKCRNDPHYWEWNED